MITLAETTRRSAVAARWITGCSVRRCAATWLAVKALRERAEASRWPALDPDPYGLGTPEKREGSAVEDERTAGLLKKQAQALDLTLWRISQAAAGGTPLPS